MAVGGIRSIVTLPERSRHSVCSVTRQAWRAAPVTAVVLGALGLALVAVCVLLTFLTRDLRASKEGLAPVLALACGLLGVLVARRQPRNPEGWLLLSLGLVVISVFDSGVYAVLDYRMQSFRQRSTGGRSTSPASMAVSACYQDAGGSQSGTKL